MNTYKVTVYEPDSRIHMGILQTWVTMARNIVAHRDLVYVLFRRDFFATYKKSFLGITWVFIAPLFGAISWIFMDKTGILNPGVTEIPYPAYVLLSTSIWALFMGVYAGAQGTLSAGTGIINQVKYPHEVLLFKQLAQQFATFSITFAVNLAILFAFGVKPGMGLFLFPILVMPLILVATGVGLVISVFGVVLPEIQKAADLILGLLIWVTPVIYSSAVPHPILQNILHWNPLTYLLGAPRDVLIYGRFESWDGYFYSSLLAVALFMVSWRLFFVAEDKIIEKII